MSNIRMVFGLANWCVLCWDGNMMQPYSCDEKSIASLYSNRDDAIETAKRVMVSRGFNEGSSMLVPVPLAEFLDFRGRS